MTDTAREALEGPEATLARLGITLDVHAPITGTVIPYQRSGDTVFFSGQVAMRNGALIAKGKLGAGVDQTTGEECARQCALNLVSRIRQALGSLDEVKAILKLTVFIASAPTFTDQHLVANGASSLLVEIFDQMAPHARSAIGVAALPLDSPVEAEIVVAVRTAT